LSVDMYESTAKRILLSQVYMLAYSAILAVIGYRRSLVFALIIVFIVATTLVQRRLGKGPLGHGRARPEDILAGRKLFEETNARELQMRDEELIREIQEQSRATMYLSLGALVGFAYFIALWPHIDALMDLVSSWLGEGRLSLFLAYLIYFEGYFIISQAIQAYGLRKAGTITSINTPQNYVVTDRGIVLKGLIGQSAIPFPLPSDATLSINEKRGFVEIVKRGKRTILKIRFYTRNPRRLAEILKRKAWQAAESRGGP